MNMRDLEYLVAVAQFKHFGRAAEACFVSQPALSMQIQKLEDTLGVKVFERNQKQVIVTDAGEEMVRRAKRILQEAKDMKAQALAMQDPYSGQCRFGAFPTLAPYLFPLILPKIKKALPKLQLFLVEEKTDVLLQQLRSGELDVAMIALPLNDNEFAFEALFDDEFLLAVSKQHPMGGAKSVKLNDICAETVLLLDEGHCLRDQALSICHRVNAKESENFRATSLETLREMVAMNEGVTLIPKTAIRKSSTLSYIPIQDPTPVRHIGLVWRKSAVKTLCFKKIGTLIQEVMLKSLK